jgi:glycosyltransferase involved in cell wall biosynthesis
MKVFIGPVEIAGLGAGWRDGLRAIGHQADLVCAYRHRFGYDNEAAPSRVAALWRRLGSWRAELPRRRFLAKSVAFALQQLAGWVVLLWALRRYDAFVFLSGETITNTRAELALLRAAGRRVIMVFVGSDARPACIDGALFPADRTFDPAAALAVMRRQIRRMRRLERGCDICVNAPATAHLHRRPFVNWFAIGIARVVAAAPEPPPQRAVVRLLHSPSHPALKGSARIQDIVARLAERGLPVELTTIVGRPNAEVIAALRDCDLVLDQLYSDTPAAGFATEGAGLGRPVLVGGYRAGAAIVRDLAGLGMPPTRYVHPDDFESELERLVRDAAERHALGRAAHAFISTQWNAAAVAQRLARVLQGDVPAPWWCEPSQVDYLHGCGLPDGVARAHVGAMLRRFGPAALDFAEDRPALRTAFAAFGQAGPAERTP